MTPKKYTSSPNLLQRIGSAITGKGQKSYGVIGDQMFYLNFLRLAAEEDQNRSVGLDNAFKNVAWVNIAISTVARNLARAEWKLYTDPEEGTEIEKGPEYDLFHYGFGGQTIYQLWEATEGWRLMRGESFWILNWGGVGGFPRRIVIPDPDCMEDVRDSLSQNILMWNYVTDKGVKIPFKVDEVVHFPMWNPMDSLRGMAELRPLDNEVDQEWAVARGHRRLLRNQSIPGGIITIPGDDTQADQAQAVIEKWNKRHQGVDRAGAVAVLGSGATFNRIALTPQEMQSLETREWNRDTILAKFGVPHAIVGLTAKTSTLAGKDTAEQMKIFWQMHLIPEIHYFEHKLDKDFFERFKLPMVGRFELDNIPELQDDQQIFRQTLREDVKAGIITINEARDQFGEEPVAWGDVYWASNLLVPQDSGDKEPANPDPNAPDADGGLPPRDVAPNPSGTGGGSNRQGISELFKQFGRPKIYTQAYRDMHWKGQIDPWETIERGYSRKLKDWLFGIRQSHLHRIMSTGNYFEIRDSIMEELTGEPMWIENTKKLRDISKPFFIEAMDETETQLGLLFRDLGLTVGTSFNIYDTNALQLLDYRVNKGSLAEISDTIRQSIRNKLKDSIASGWSEKETADALRDTFNIASNRAPMIARTEIGGVINDSRVEGFKAEGFHEHEWLSARDDRVRDSHQIDGEVVTIGERFSNGLLYPNDPAGAPEEVINCRCLSLPVFDTASPEADQNVSDLNMGEDSAKPDMEKIAREAAEKVKADMASMIGDLTKRLEAAERRPDPVKVDVHAAPVNVTVQERKQGRTVFEQDDFGNVIAAHEEEK